MDNLLRKLGLILALMILSSYLWPIMVLAAPTSPGVPLNFDAVLATNTHVQLTWNMGAGATLTVIRGKYGSAPTTITDGYAVYSGNLTACDDWIPNIDYAGEPLYYSAWSYNLVGYSLTYTTDYVEGTVVPVRPIEGSIGMIGLAFFLFVGLVGNLFAWVKNKWWVLPVLAFYWMGVTYHCYTQSSDFDFYRFATWVCAGFVIITLGEIWLLRQRAEEQPEETMYERNKKRIDANLQNTFNRGE